ncbi:hypothetical protein DDB_G0268128 [Dictyostelium discoideum AX4]|uniref:Uncharacterized protein n=1 Tax=Dictyostelium discoideum TaxID=44689 RepID=Q55FG1_DICDI|nr:hypothetical protein DDB_G0268128 [Dictyostelium discoideum AX4]EAL73517.1 hypothetical protein DDB_G0268128 [Dictyostelium discoideum AX4]|eukprot:XP_647572.1 hypothetical protein DDB_G0268128 [Dictyostelium discoideum AX4]
MNSLNTNSIENNTLTIHSREKIPLMCYDRSLKPLKEGGWGILEYTITTSCSKDLDIQQIFTNA